MTQTVEEEKGRSGGEQPGRGMLVVGYGRGQFLGRYSLMRGYPSQERLVDGRFPDSLKIRKVDLVSYVLCCGRVMRGGSLPGAAALEPIPVGHWQPVTESLREPIGIA